MFDTVGCRIWLSAKGHDPQGGVASFDHRTRPETGYDEIVVRDPLIRLEDMVGAKAASHGGIICLSS